MADWLSREFHSLFGDVVNDVSWLSHRASNLVVNEAVGTTRNRPHPWSTFSDYTSWQGLTDRTYLARHLPPVANPPNLPDPAHVQRLFARPGGTQTLSAKSTCLFPAFAQYLTDGFIRTDPTNAGKTTSNHEIDLCPLYGRTPAQTAILRLKSEIPEQRGRLKSQIINGEEYASFLYVNNGAAPDLAFRVAGALQHRNQDWDDERVFQTARNIMIPMFIKIVIEQYINHITPLPFKLVADPSVGWHANWNRPNWMTAEFSLLYRWHSLMPDHIEWSGEPPTAIPLANFGLDNTPLLKVGLDAAFSAAAAQPAAELGALNTADPLLDLEIRAVLQARFNRLDTYNNYRVAFGMPVARHFDDITDRPEVVAVLKGLYATPDEVEFYPGLFAETRVTNSPLPGLLLRMVAVDAFSQALTNPLLSEHIFNATTFTQWGFDLIHNTGSLGDILSRNVPAPSGRPIIMTQPTWVSE